eukprot:302548_1
MTVFYTCLLLLIVFGESKLNDESRITITTALGDIMGNIKDVNAPEKVYEFLGIQYGVAPIGNLRFRPSQLNTSWNTSTYDATTYGPECIQPLGGNKMSEDCLYLNIWTTNIDKKNLLPVMFFIHGGAYMTGAGSGYDGHNMVANGKDFVLVTINYRLGCLGFLQSKQLYDEDPKWKSYGGMNGLYDQIQALNWVKRFVSSFGGDPNQITIFGESAGGTSVCQLAVSPMVAPNTFQRAIVESGSCIGPWMPQTVQAGLESSNKLLTQNHLSTDISVLRTYPASKLNIEGFYDSIDGLVLTQEPYLSYTDLTANGVVFNTKELIMGFNSMDGIIGFPFHGGATPQNEVQYTQYVNTYIKNKTQANLIETVYYPLSDFPPYSKGTSASVAWESLNGDVCVSCPTMYQMQQIGKQKINGFTGYVYEFRGGGSPYYAPHASELDFVFDWGASAETFYAVKWDQTLSNQMVSAWSNYGKYGVPNSTVSGSEIQWKSFTETQNVIVWDDKARVKENYLSTFRHGACEFWYNEVGFDVMMNICLDS